MESTARLRKRVLAGLGAVALLFLVLGALPVGDYLEGLFLNLGTELVGAAATYWALDLLIGSRAAEEAREKEREAKKADLIAQMGSQVHDVAIAAAEELRRQGWLRDASLRRATLEKANLQGAGLAWANLKEADLGWANLQWASVSGANLQGASLRGANLQETHLSEHTTLPDGTKWTPDTDMARFTDADHPDFWRPDA